VGVGDSSGSVEFRILGPLEVVAAERRVPVKPAKARALLALLLVDPGRTVSADRLIDELWGEAPPASANVSLRVLVSRLRAALASSGAPDAIETRSPGYALCVERNQIDAGRFEWLLSQGREELQRGQPEAAAATLRDGLALWRGPALADLPDYPATASEAARLDELKVAALEERVDADLACDRHDLVVGELEQLVREYPFRERLWRALMLALYRSGRQADALAAFTQVRERLVNELGIEPSPGLRELQHQILEQSPELSLASPEPGVRGGPRGDEDMPTGVVTFLLTDVEGSSGLWERAPEAMASVVERLEAIIREAVLGAGGVLVKTKGEGDSTFSVFARATDAVCAALALQRELDTESWPGGIELKLRVALHTGEAQERDADYFGTAVNRAARLRSLAQPGQVLVSQTTAQVAGHALPTDTSLLDLGRRSLRGLARDERVFELRVGSGPLADELPQFDRKLPSELSVASDVFVGRQAEIDVLIGLWRFALEGSLRTALLAGEPGIGKTRLAAELARRAHADGAVVLFGRCDEDLGVPYQPFSEALRAYVQACPSAELAAQAGQRAGELARLVPELGERLLGARPTSTGDPEEQRDRLFEAVASLLAGASHARPVLLVLDDLHWAARPTLLLLRHVLRSREAMRLLLLGTYRDTELDRAHPLAQVLADLRREPVQIERLRVRGLDADAVSAYVAATGGRAVEPDNIEFARALYESTEGNPFFIGEVLRHLIESGLARQEDGRWVAAAEIADIGLPEGVKDVIARRLSRLSDAANRALAVASVIGPTFSLLVLERVEAGEHPDELLDAVEEALRAGLISETGPSSYSFSHALICQTLYEELTSTRRVRLHRRIGEAIEQAPGADRQLEALAHHFAAAALDGQIAKAADYALAAGHRALNRLAPEEAVARLERGLELLDLEPSADRARQADLLLALAQARSELLDMQGNHTAALAAAGAARSIGSAERLARAALVYWPPAGTGVDDPTLPELVEQALDAVGNDHLTLRALLTTRLTFYRAYPLGQGFAKVDEAERALALARQTGNDEALAAALRLTIRVLYGTTRIAEQVSLADELLTIGRRTGEQRSELLALAFRCNAHIQLGDRACYDADLAELRRRAAEVGTRRARYILAVTHGLQALMEGRFAEVERLSEHALAFGGLQTDRLAGHPARITRLYWEQGRLEEATDASREWAQRIRGHPVARASTARLQAELGDHEAAHSLLDELMANDLAAVPRDLHWPCVLADLAALCCHLHEAEQASRLSPHLRPYRGHVLLMGGHLCMGAADRFLGMLAHTVGRLDDASAHYTTALELEQRLKAAPLTARTRYWCARTLHTRGAAGDEERAITLLEAALVTTRELGMSSLAGDAKELLGTSRQTLA
jgi:DNA-binding SARP family transcriptional activator/class 3 adenylate cyclase